MGKCQLPTVFSMTLLNFRHLIGDLWVFCKDRERHEWQRLSTSTYGGICGDGINKLARLIHYVIQPNNIASNETHFYIVPSPKPEVEQLKLVRGINSIISKLHALFKEKNVSIYSTLNSILSQESLPTSTFMDGEEISFWRGKDRRSFNLKSATDSQCHRFFQAKISELEHEANELSQKIFFS